MAKRLNWEKQNRKDKVKNQGCTDGRNLQSLRRIEAEHKRHGRILTEEEKKSLHYIMTGERI